MDRQAFFERLAVRWERSHEARVRHPAVRLGLGRIGPLEGRTVVDVGCGTGLLAAHVLPVLGAGRLIAIDFAEEMVTRARARFPDPRVSWLACDALESGLASASVDVVLCYDALPHFPDKARALREFARWLRDGGKLLIWHDVGRDRLAEVHARGGGPIDADLLPPAEQLGEVLASAGLDVVLVEETPTSYSLLAVRPAVRSARDRAPAKRPGPTTAVAGAGRAG